MSLAVTGMCALCRKNAELEESHIVPAFAFRWLKGRSATEHIRNSRTPNMRVQDGEKKPLLCAKCEDLIGTSETLFATKLFHPWMNGTLEVAYREWLLRFCVSVSWRVLIHTKGQNPKARYSEEQDRLAVLAEKAWREFLLGNRPHPGNFEQHLLIFGNVTSSTVPDVPTNINRFLAGPIMFDIVGTGSSLMTFAKLGPFSVFGMIQKSQAKWDGTKVHVKHGVIRPQKIAVPYGLAQFYNDKAREVAAIYEEISETQKRKIDAAMELAVQSDPNKFLASKHYASMRADAELFGEHVIISKRKVVP